jgi:hypothetical protein
LRIGVAEQRAVRLARDDFRVAELSGGMLDHIGYQQGPMHDEAGLEHFLSLLDYPLDPKRQNPATQVRGA